MARHRIILDCDPGVDDAVAILLALGSPAEIELLGITCVAGNVPLDKTARNARRVCTLAGRHDVPVLAGCARPLMSAVGRTASVHGVDGLADVGFPEPAFELGSQHAVDFIIEQAMAGPGGVTLCCVGPMTNAAVALIKEPRLAQRLDRILFMGGAAFCPGNVSPVAEFNVFVDPHAAHVVLESGLPLTMFGLDVTHQARATAERLAAWEARGGPVIAAAARMVRAYRGGDPCLHDACVIAYLIDPGLFGGVDAHVAVECESPRTLGQTVARTKERHLAGDAPNCHVVTHVEADRFFDLLTARL
jgi:inosine-uridine nucleoside N-ribohydrolase